MYCSPIPLTYAIFFAQVSKPQTSLKPHFLRESESEFASSLQSSIYIWVELKWRPVPSPCRLFGLVGVRDLNGVLECRRSPGGLDGMAVDVVGGGGAALAVQLLMGSLSPALLCCCLRPCHCWINDGNSPCEFSSLTHQRPAASSLPKPSTLLQYDSRRFFWSQDALCDFLYTDSS